MRFLNEDDARPERITKVIIEAEDLSVDGLGVCIQVEGYKGSPEEMDSTNSQIYIEKWKKEAKIVVWNDSVEPEIFTLKESKEGEDNG